jgi:hypothetical protein
MRRPTPPRKSRKGLAEARGFDSLWKLLCQGGLGVRRCRVRAGWPSAGYCCAVPAAGKSCWWLMVKRRVFWPGRRPCRLPRRTLRAAGEEYAGKSCDKVYLRRPVVGQIWPGQRPAAERARSRASRARFRKTDLLAGVPAGHGRVSGAGLAYRSSGVPLRPAVTRTRGRIGARRRSASARPSRWPER